jgi:hypothetical protein
MDRQSGCVYGAGACLAILGILSLLRAEESGKVFEPASGEPGSVDSLPRGEVLLFSVLQGLADVSGARVVLRTSDPPETKLLLSRPIQPFDESGAVRTLEGAGFQVKRTRRAGKTEYEVEKAASPARPKGKLKPSGAGSSPTDSPEAAPGRPAAERAPIAESPGGPRLYELHEGAGSRFVVILETDSREEAEDALKLLEAQRSSRSGRKPADKTAAPRTEGADRNR